jgi:putative transposase
MEWKQLLASISESVDDHLRLRNDYLMAENRILRHQIDGRVPCTDSERKALAEIGAKLGKKALEEIATIAQPDTILAWHRQCADPRVDTSVPRKSVGRPRVDKEIEHLVVRMACENRSWGYDRIVGALANLGYTISDQTVDNILKRHGIPPAPERKKTMTWGEFIRIHLDVLGATDFFSSEMWTWLGFVIASVLSYIHLDRRRSHVTSIKLSLNAWRMITLLRWSLDLYAYLERGIDLVKEERRLQRGLYGGGICRQPLSESSCYNHLGYLRRGMGQVVFRPVVNPHAIRDGPIPRRQRPSEFVSYTKREAA